MIVNYTEVLYFLGLKSSDLDDYDETLIKTYINTAEELVLKYLNRGIEKAEYTEYISGKNTQKEILRNFPIDNNASFTLYYKNSFDAYTEISADNYSVDYERGIIYKASVFEEGFQNYKVVYTAGYDNENIPFAIKLAIKIFLKILWEKHDQNANGLVNYHAGDVIQKYDDSLIPIDVIRLLKSYKYYSFK